MIRFALVCITVVGFLILSIPILIGEWILGKWNPMKKDMSSLRLIQRVFRFILKITGCQIIVIGQEQVPQDQAVLYIGNHRSLFDTLLTYSRCPRRTGYVAKKEMLKFPLLRDWMKNLHCQFLDRENLKEGLKTILASIELIRQGISVCIFPEGTRSTGPSELEMLPFHEGSFKVAVKGGCPIVPMAITGSAEIFENHFPKITPCRVILEYGAPIYPDRLEKEDQKHLGAYTQGVILAMLKKHQEL